MKSHKCSCYFFHSKVHSTEFTVISPSSPECVWPLPHTACTGAIIGIEQAVRGNCGFFLCYLCRPIATQVPVDQSHNTMTSALGSEKAMKIKDSNYLLITC